MHPRTLLLGSAALLLAATPAALWLRSDGADAAQLSAAARAVLDTLDDTQRAKAVFTFDAAERKNWNFLPNVYPGIPFGDLSVDQRRKVHALLNATLSGAGYLKTTTIMQLEDVLRRLAESRGQKAPTRDPARYALAFFGAPDAAAWGYRLQGHHISLNVTCVEGRVAATTPAFLGANPAEVRHGAHAGLRALPDEEDLGFALLHSLTDAQRKLAVLADEAPRDVLFAPGRKKDVLGALRGVAYAGMTPPQRQLLERLLRTYVGNMQDAIARAHYEKLRAAGMDRIHFAWMGAQKPGKGHYYRLHGPTFAVEYDNTQNGANHVHTVWHDLTDDFAEDLLLRHYDVHHRDAADGKREIR